jgi:hypothetical protein
LRSRIHRLNRFGGCQLWTPELPPVSGLSFLSLIIWNPSNYEGYGMLLIALMKQVQGPPQLWMTGDVRHPQSWSMLKKQEKKPILSRSTKRMGERRATDNQRLGSVPARYETTATVLYIPDMKLLSVCFPFC